MPFTKLLKPVVTKAHKTILIADHHSLDQAQLDLFNDLIKPFAFVIKRRADIFHPQTYPGSILLARSSQRFFLKSAILFLTRGRHTSIRNHQPLFRGNQPTIGQILFVRVVAPVSGGTKSGQNAFPIPLLQRVHGLSDQFAKLLR